MCKSENKTGLCPNIASQITSNPRNAIVTAKDNDKKNQSQCHSIIDHIASER
jgi:hypothetical protein